MQKKFDRYFYHSYFRLLSVVAVQSLIVYSVNLVDSIMLGSYSEAAMSGVSLANQLQFLLQCIVNGVANGLVVIASQYWGKKNLAPIKKLFAAAVWTGLLISALLSAAVIAAPAEVLGIFSNESEIIAAGAGYARIIGCSYIIFTLSNLFIALMRSVETVKIGFYTSVLALIVNISLNYLLIFGKLDFPELGAEGAAIATLTSRIAELIAVVIYVFFFDKKLRLRPAEVFKSERIYALDFIRAGLPLIGSGGSWGVAMAVQTAIIGRLGAAAIGANAIASPVFQIVAVLYSASSSASGVIIGKTVGENDIPRVKKYAVKLQIIYIITGIVSCLLLLGLRNPILSLYNVSAETGELALLFMNIFAVTVIGSAYEAPCLCGIVSGGGDTKFVLFNDLIFMWGLVLPLSLLSAFVFKWPVGVTFFILKADQIAKCFVAIPKVNRFKWIRILTRGE